MHTNSLGGHLSAHMHMWSPLRSNSWEGSICVSDHRHTYMCVCLWSVEPYEEVGNPWEDVMSAHTLSLTRSGILGRTSWVHTHWALRGGQESLGGGHECTHIEPYEVRNPWEDVMSAHTLSLTRSGILGRRSWVHTHWALRGGQESLGGRHECTHIEPYEEVRNPWEDVMSAHTLSLTRSGILGRRSWVHTHWTLRGQESLGGRHECTHIEPYEVRNPWEEVMSAHTLSLTRSGILGRRSWVHTHWALRGSQESLGGGPECTHIEPYEVRNPWEDVMSAHTLSLTRKSGILGRRSWVHTHWALRGQESLGGGREPLGGSQECTQIP